MKGKNIQCFVTIKYFQVLFLIFYCFNCGKKAKLSNKIHEESENVHQANLIINSFFHIAYILLNYDKNTFIAIMLSWYTKQIFVLDL